MSMKNAASRVLSVLKAGNAIGRQSGPAYIIWGKVLNFEGDVSPDRMDFAVAAAMQILRAEIDEVEEAVRKANIPETVWKKHTDQAKNIFRVSLLGSDWPNTHAQLGVEGLLVAFSFLPELLPAEESAIEPDELKSLLVLASELEALLQVSTLPRPLLRALQHLVDLIHEALRLYPLAGAKKVWEAAAHAAGEVVLSGASSHTDEPEVQKAKDLWERTRTVAEAALTAGELYQLGSTAWDTATKLLGN